MDSVGNSNRWSARFQRVESERCVLKDKMAGNVLEIEERLCQNIDHYIHILGHSTYVFECGDHMCLQSPCLSYCSDCVPRLRPCFTSSSFFPTLSLFTLFGFWTYTKVQTLQCPYMYTMNEVEITLTGLISDIC